MRINSTLLQYGDAPNTHIVLDLERNPLFLITYRDERTELNWPVSSLVVGPDVIDILR
jgi:hypothetical protein